MTTPGIDASQPLRPIQAIAVYKPAPPATLTPIPEERRPAPRLGTIVDAYA